MISSVFGPTKQEVTGSWIKFHNDIYNSSSSDACRMAKQEGMRFTGYVAHMEDINAFKMFVGKFEKDRRDFKGTQVALWTGGELFWTRW